MKKYIFFFLVILLSPVIVYGEKCDVDKISIESIAMDKSSGNVLETNQASVTDKKISLKLSMSDVDDNIRYKIIVKNESNNDFELDSKVINGDSKYIEYKFDLDNNSNIVKAKSSKTVYLEVKYKDKIPEELFEHGKYVDKNDILVNLSTQSDIENPKTGIGLRNLLTCILLITVIGIALKIIVKKKIPMKTIAFLIVGLSFIPFVIYAICKCEINIESVVEIVDKDFILCKRAKTLKTEKCTNYDYSGQCYAAGYYNEGTMGTDIITFGSLGTPGELNTGDAFICDVNRDNEYDEDNERFYYVTDYYDTINNKFDESVATLLYDANMNEGVRDITTFNAYSETASALDGPTEGVKHLPTTSDWPKIKLKNSKRQIRTITGETSVDGHQLPIFDYGNKAARLLTWQEINRACGLTNENLDEWHVWPRKCEYMFSNLAFSSKANKAYSFFTETNYNSSQVWMVYSFSMRMFSIDANDANTRGIRPVIDVPKERIVYN